jgi:nitrite reductase/ring-hydroxylating ferredoxin subunit
MAEFITVAATGDVEEGAAKAFEVKGAEVAVARSGSALYAFSDICTHRHCNLSMGGEIEGTTIQCECHGSMFSMETGEVIEGPATEPIQTYGVREQDGQIQIEARRLRGRPDLRHRRRVARRRHRGGRTPWIGVRRSSDHARRRTGCAL